MMPLDVKAGRAAFLASFHSCLTNRSIPKRCFFEDRLAAWSGAADATAYLCAVPLALPADPTRIRLASTVEVNYWCQTLNCTETRLRNAVLAVGPLAADM